MVATVLLTAFLIRDWPKYGSFMALPQDYRAAINWAEHEIKARGMDQTREVEMER
jgi:hypothetical protein